MTDPRPRNIVLIMTDQHRADLSAREGFPLDTTPVLDTLAEGGAWFDRAYTSAPLCVPARISLLTGRFPSAHGVRENFGYSSPSYLADLMDVAAAAGYRTAVIGKNHSHLTPERVDVFIEYGHLGRIGETPEGADGEFDAWLRDLGFETAMQAAPYGVEQQLPHRIVDDTIGFLSAHPTGRNLVWMSIPEPHVPYQVPEPYFTRTAPGDIPPAATSGLDVPADDFAWRYAASLGEHSSEADPDVLARARANYLGMLQLIDDQIGRLVAHLDTTGQLAETLLVFVADHGDFVGEYGLMRKGPGVPEVLVRIPMLFAGSGIHGGRSAAHVSIVDIFPTLCELMGQPIPPGTQGRSLVGVLDRQDEHLREFESVYVEQGIGGLRYDETDAGGERPGVSVDARGRVTVDTLNAVTQSGLLRMVRAGRHKIVQDLTGTVHLYDLERDPFELEDIAGRAASAKVESQMLKRLSGWLMRVADPIPIPAEGYPRKVDARNYCWDDNLSW